MRAIVRSAALIGLTAALACADAHDDVLEVVTSMAAALTEVNVAKFMEGISKDMADYETIENNVTALVRQAEVTSSIQPVNESGDDQMRSINLDWSLEVRSLEQDGPIVRRRQVVHCDLRKDRKHWKVVALKPLDFFAPAKLGQ
jgi:hypothetical protein